MRFHLRALAAGGRQHGSRGPAARWGVCWAEAAVHSVVRAAWGYLQQWQ